MDAHFNSLIARLISLECQIEDLPASHTDATLEAEKAETYAQLAQYGERDILDDISHPWRLGL